MTMHDANAKSADTGTVNATISGWGMGYSIAVLFNAVLTLLKENLSWVHELMVAFAGHHWVAQGILDVAVFVVVGWLLARSGKEMEASTLNWWIVGSTIVGGGTIVGFFLL